LKGSLGNQKWFFYGIPLKNHFRFQMAPSWFRVHESAISNKGRPEKGDFQIASGCHVVSYLWSPDDCHPNIPPSQAANGLESPVEMVKDLRKGKDLLEVISAIYRQMTTTTRQAQLCNASAR